MTPEAHTQKNRGWALFLDVDGTLLEIAATPQEVRASGRIKDLLRDLSIKLDGALALVSGRSIADLDRLFAPYRLHAAGVHGVERRGARGVVEAPQIDSARLNVARRRLEALVRRRQGLLLEDKGRSLAVHFRLAPHLSGLVYDEVAAALAALGPDFVIQQGKCVFEIRARGFSKGSAVEAFMNEAPFAGRTPIFAGDDLTDEDAFAVVNRLGGVSIRVGGHGHTLAQRRLESVRDVHRWLEAFAAEASGRELSAAGASIWREAARSGEEGERE